MSENALALIEPIELDLDDILWIEPRSRIRSRIMTARVSERGVFMNRALVRACWPLFGDDEAMFGRLGITSTPGTFVIMPVSEHNPRGQLVYRQSGQLGSMTNGMALLEAGIRAGRYVLNRSLPQSLQAVFTPDDIADDA